MDFPLYWFFKALAQASANGFCRRRAERASAAADQSRNSQMMSREGKFLATENTEDTEDEIA